MNIGQWSFGKTKDLAECLSEELRILRNFTLNRVDSCAMRENNYL